MNNQICALGIKVLNHKKEGSLSSPGGSSYMFLSVTNPETRQGVVGGWISSDRGSVISVIQSQK